MVFSQMWRGKVSDTLNPLQPVESGDLVVLISTWPEAVQGVKHAQHRQWCTIIAPTEVVDWLAALGYREQLQTSFEKDGC